MVLIGFCDLTTLPHSFVCGFPLIFHLCAYFWCRSMLALLLFGTSNRPTVLSISMILFGSLFHYFCEFTKLKIHCNTKHKARNALRFASAENSVTQRSQVLRLQFMHMVEVVRVRFGLHFCVHARPTYTKFQ